MSGRQQVGIERLPTRRLSNEPRESMNCKSCRKRKIKWNRLRPTCEACQVFQCSCVYDATPKNRGPKTDVLQALLKRVDGLEKRLKDEGTEGSPTNDGESGGSDRSINGDCKPERSLLDTHAVLDDLPVYSPSIMKFVSWFEEYGPTLLSVNSEPSPGIRPDLLLDTYFLRCQGKPFHILDEPAIRERFQMSQIPSYLLHAIYTVGARFAILSQLECPAHGSTYAIHPNGYDAAVRLSEDYARRARMEIDIDDPSIDAIQCLLLVASAFTAAGKGKKAYMMLVVSEWPWLWNCTGRKTVESG